MYIRPRSYSEPQPHYNNCVDCDEDFRLTQQHYDHKYDKSGLCSWPCVVSHAIEKEQRMKQKAKEIVIIYFRVKNSNQ